MSRQPADTAWRTAAELAATVLPVGTVTPRQLVRFQHEDVLSRPRVVRLGRGKGSRSEYPPQAVSQLRRLVQLGPRSYGFPALRFLLWMDGFDVPLARVRESFSAILDPTARRRLIKSDLREWAAAQPLPLAGNAGIAEHALLAALIGREQDFTHDYLEAELGEEPSLAELVETFTGLDALRSTYTAAFHADPLGPIGAALQAISDRHVADIDGLAATLSDAGDAELVTARRDVRISRLFVVLLPYVERWYGGVGKLGLFAEAMNDPLSLLISLAFCILTRQHDGDAAAERANRGLLRAVKEIVSALPPGTSLEAATRAVEDRRRRRANGGDG